MSDNLLPCPFCGGVASILTTQFEGKIFYDIGCNTDKCIMRSGSDIQYTTKESAKKEWNTRAIF